MATDGFTLDRFLDLPRVSGLVVAPDGGRLVTTLATAGERFTTALWELDPTGGRPPRRLTRSTTGEAGPAFLPDGSLLFTSARPDPDRPTRAGRADADRPDTDVARLWVLPAAGGEARVVAAPPGGVHAVAVARDSGAVALVVAMHPKAADADADAARERARADAGVSARLFERYPIRHWDSYLGPRERRLSVAAPPDDEGHLTLVEITATPGRALDDVSFDLTPDGATLVSGWWRDTTDPTALTVDLVALDVASGSRRILADDGAHYGDVACSPDGRRVACVRTAVSTPDAPGERRLVIVDLRTGERSELAAQLDRRPGTPVWTQDSSAVVVTADDDGHTLPFRVDLVDGAVTRLALEGAFTDVCATADGSALYALRSTPTHPPHAVALDPRQADQNPRILPTPGADTTVPGTVERIEATADDGTRVPSWLVLPAGASPAAPAPLLVWVHGGPVASWSGWHWRWNPHVLAEQGYAVLMPDPALSTGYGHEHIARGWGRWGAEPYTDVLAAADAAGARDDIDEDRTALMGGSFGGYMANWAAGHTDRFRCIVTHASLWDLEQFHGTTDLGVWWEREFGDRYADPARYREYSPSRMIGHVRTPMLVIHGERDHRVPVGEALALWTDLARHGVDAKFLHFPDEHHWIEKPANIRLWYETVLAFVDHHLRSAPWQRPELL